MSRFLSEGLGWLRRSLSEHEGVAEAASGSSPRLPQQRSLDLPSQPETLHEHADSDIIEPVHGGAAGAKRAARCISEGGAVGACSPLVLRPDHFKVHDEEDENKENEALDASYELEVNGDSVLMSLSEMLAMSEHLPPRLIGSPWNLLFSTETDGFSLNNIYRKMESLPSAGHTLLVIQDTDGAVFGALSSHSFRPSESFYGTGETFLFALQPAPLRIWKWTSRNEFFVSCSPSSLVVGAGDGIFGLSIDSDLCHGRSQPCQTFDNEQGCLIISWPKGCQHQSAITCFSVVCSGGLCR